jgi:hypothetical protein
MWKYEQDYRLVAEERRRPDPVMLETHNSTLRMRPGILVGVVFGCAMKHERVRF